MSEISHISENDLSPEQEPFRHKPFEIAPEWLTWQDGTVKKMAIQIQKDNPFKHFPILADALEDAGCDDPRLLSHLRQCSQHTKECWVLNSLIQGEIEPCIEEWAQFYEKHFAMEPDWSTVELPERTKEEEKEFTRPIVVAKGLTLEHIWQALKKQGEEHQFSCYHYQPDINLDQLVPTHERDACNANDPKHISYAIWIRPGQEADPIPDGLGLSVNDVEEQGLETMTLPEYLLNYLKFDDQNKDKPEARQHLDTEDYTLIAGSRDSDGFALRADWDSGPLGVYVYWSPSDTRVRRVRPRRVVSWPAQASEK